MELVNARIIADGNHDKAFASQVMEVDKTSAVNIKVLHRGGFVISLTPIAK